MEVLYRPEPVSQVFSKLRKELAGVVADIDKIVVVTKDGSRYISTVDGMARINNDYALSDLAPQDHCSHPQEILNKNVLHLIENALMEYQCDAHEAGLLQKLIEGVQGKLRGHHEAG